MATALIPILTSVAPEIISLITGLVHKSAPAAEATYGAGTGPVKLATVFGDVMTALQSAASAGTISKTLPADSEVQLIIQSVVASLQASGALTSPVTPTVTPATTQTVTLASGQSLTIRVQ